MHWIAPAEKDAATDRGAPLITRITDSNVAPRYSIIVPEDTTARAAEYLKALRLGRSQPGALLRARLQNTDLPVMTEQDLLAALFDTKQAQIFAETAVAGDGSDWHLDELGLLGRALLLREAHLRLGAPR